jgi:hypothetical protein
MAEFTVVAAGALAGVAMESNERVAAGKVPLGAGLS